MSQISNREYFESIDAELHQVYKKIQSIGMGETLSLVEAAVLTQSLNKLLVSYIVKKRAIIDMYQQRLQQKLDDTDATIEILKDLQVLLVLRSNSQ